MRFFAQLNQDGIVIAVTQNIDDLPTLPSERKVEIQSLEDTLLGKRYNRDTGEFETIE